MAKAPTKPEAADDEVDEDAEADEATAAAAPPAAGRFGAIIAIAAVTVLAGGLGAALGMQTAAHVERTLAERAKAEPAQTPIRSVKYSGDTVLEPLEPVITNLAAPSDIWIRLETAIVFENGVLKNPAVTSAEIRQDIIAYAHTLSLAQLEGPSALQHLREDLNERVAVRTNGQVSELLIQTLIVQ